MLLVLSAIGPGRASAASPRAFCAISEAANAPICTDTPGPLTAGRSACVTSGPGTVATLSAPCAAVAASGSVEAVDEGGAGGDADWLGVICAGLGAPAQARPSSPPL